MIVDIVNLIVGYLTNWRLVLKPGRYMTDLVFLHNILHVLIFHFLHIFDLYFNVLTDSIETWIGIDVKFQLVDFDFISIFLDLGQSFLCIKQLSDTIVDVDKPLDLFLKIQLSNVFIALMFAFHVNFMVLLKLTGV